MVYIHLESAVLRQQTRSHAEQGNQGVSYKTGKHKINMTCRPLIWSELPGGNYGLSGCRYRYRGGRHRHPGWEHAVAWLPAPPAPPHQRDLKY